MEMNLSHQSYYMSMLKAYKENDIFTLYGLLSLYLVVAILDFVTHMN